MKQKSFLSRSKSPGEAELGSPYISKLKEKDPCHPLAHRGSSAVGEGHQEHHRGPGTMCLQHGSWGQLLKGKILLEEKEHKVRTTNPCKIQTKLKSTTATIKIKTATGQSEQSIFLLAK